MPCARPGLARVCIILHPTPLRYPILGLLSSLPVSIRQPDRIQERVMWSEPPGACDQCYVEGGAPRFPTGGHRVHGTQEAQVLAGRHLRPRLRGLQAPQRLRWGPHGVLSELPKIHLIKLGPKVLSLRQHVSLVYTVQTSPCSLAALWHLQCIYQLSKWRIPSFCVTLSLLHTQTRFYLQSFSHARNILRTHSQYTLHTLAIYFTHTQAQFMHTYMSTLRYRFKTWHSNNA